ncbi:MAG: hypothetical protein ACLS95_08900 [Clostridia bacterium]
MKKTVFDDLEPYIDERINSNILYFKKNKKLNNLENRYNDCLETLRKKLPLNEKKIIESLYSLHNDISVSGNYISYRIGLIDGITIKDFLQKKS